LIIDGKWQSALSATKLLKAITNRKSISIELADMRHY
jgi:hypothetical protein